MTHPSLSKAKTYSIGIVNSYFPSVRTQVRSSVISFTDTQVVSDDLFEMTHNGLNLTTVYFSLVIEYAD